MTYQVSLEFGKIDVQCTVESEGGGDGGNDLTNKTVQVGVGWSFNVQVTSADIVNSLVIDHKGTVGVFKGGMGGQNGVVWLNNGSCNLRCWVDGKFKF